MERRLQNLCRKEKVPRICYRSAWSAGKDEMSDIANELRERSLRAEQEGEPLALLDDAAEEIERLRLTDAEREAIAAGLGALEAIYDDEPQISRPLYDAYAPTLRGLLERTK